MSAQIGCKPTDATLLNPTGGTKAIAIVDAYDYPSAFSDLELFSAQFGLLAPNFQVVYATGTPPKADSGWGLDAALDIEWAHAMAPGAKLEAQADVRKDVAVGAHRYENGVHAIFLCQNAVEMSSLWTQ